ncbi:MAG: transcriptional regulator [Pyrobaculum sp.]
MEIKDLAGLFKPPLDNTTRMLILIALYVHGRLEFVELLYLTGAPKSSLHYHLSELEKHGLIALRKAVRSRQVTVAELTDKGRQVVEQVLKALSGLKRQS